LERLSLMQSSEKAGNKASVLLGFCCPLPFNLKARSMGHGAPLDFARGNWGMGGGPEPLFSLFGIGSADHTVHRFAQDDRVPAKNKEPGCAL
jgi:hypothetical protein